MSQQTWHDLIKPGQYIEKTQDDEGRYFVPADAMVGRPSGGPWTNLVWEGVKRRFHDVQRPERRGEKVISGRRPTFLDVVLNRAAGLEVRSEDDYDRANQDDPDVAISEFLDVLESEQEKALPDWKASNYVEKALAALR